MRVIVGGDIKNPVLLNTNKATSLIIETEDGRPAVIFKMLEDGNGFLRLTKGEDDNFDEIARQLGLN